MPACRGSLTRGDALLKRIDRYLLGLSLGNLGAIAGIIMSLMVLEHLPRLLEITRLSGRRGYIVGQTLLGLLPEYAGIGLLVGLYMAFALAIRKLALQGELSVFEATGIRPLRWMRMPMVLTLLGALFVLANQGWIQPDGERRVAEIGERMASGEFGYSLAMGEFHDLGDGTTVYFDEVEPGGGSLGGLMVFDRDRTYSATEGKLAIYPDGSGMVELHDGLSLVSGESEVMQFSNFAYRLESAAEPGLESAGSGDGRQSRTLDELWQSPLSIDHAEALGRLLWVMLVLLTPIMALAFARPPMRSESPVGMMAGLVLLIAFLKTITLVSSTIWISPVVDAVVLAGCWAAILAALQAWQRHAGFGALDRALTGLGKRVWSIFASRSRVASRPPAPAFA